MSKFKKRKKKVEPKRVWKCPRGHISPGEPSQMVVTGFRGLPEGGLKFHACWRCLIEYAAMNFPISQVVEE